MATQLDPTMEVIAFPEPLHEECTGGETLPGVELESAGGEQGLESCESLALKDRDQLRTILDLYEKALHDLKTFALEKSLDKQFDLSDGDKLYDRLETKIASPDFLDKLGSIHEASLKDPSEGQDEQGSWDLITEMDLTSTDLKDSRNCLDPETYIVVNQEDIIEGMACFMARYVSSLPQTKGMTPKQLQNALKKAFGVPKKGRLRKLWNGSKVLYTAASWGATAVSLYNNPALVKAASVAFWTSIQVMTKYI